MATRRDWPTAAGHPARGGLFAAILSLICGRRWLEDRRDDYFAALVEQRHPELGNRFINALQLGRGTQAGVSRNLIDAIVSDADRSAGDLDLGDSIDRQPVNVLPWLPSPPSFSSAAMPSPGRRTSATPWPASSCPWATSTLIPTLYIAEVDPRSTNVPEGTPLTITARVEGSLPSSARLYRRSGKGPWQPSIMLVEEAKPTPSALPCSRFTPPLTIDVEAGEGSLGPLPDQRGQAAANRARQRHLTRCRPTLLPNLAPSIPPTATLPA